MRWLIVVWLITGCGRIGFDSFEKGPGAYNATVTLDSSNEWIIQMVALRPR